MRRLITWATIVFSVVAISDATAMSESAAKALDAARFEKWSAVRRFAPELSGKSDFAAFIAVLNACIAQRCKDNPPKNLTAEWFTPEIVMFGQAWIDVKSRNPARGRDRFRELARVPGHAWLGIYGLLEYAVETESTALLRETLKQAESFEKAEPAIAELAADARLLLAVLERDYDMLARLLDDVGMKASSEAQLERRVDFMIWKHDIAAAEKIVQAYTAKFGKDHVAVRANIAVREKIVSARQLQREISALLKTNPNYWSLVLVGISLVDGDDSARTSAFLAAEKKLPMNLSHLQLMRFYRLAQGSSKHAQMANDQRSDLASRYPDYPMYHVAVATLAKREGDISQAHQHLDVALRLNPSDIGALSNKAYLALEGNDLQQAGRLLTQVASYDPNNVFAKLILARVHLMSANYEEARQVLRAVRTAKGHVPLEEVTALEREVEDASKKHPPKR